MGYTIIFKHFNGRFFSLLFLFFIFLATGCKNDDNEPQPLEQEVPKVTGNTKTFVVNASGASEISGTVTFIENTDDSITIVTELKNTQGNTDYNSQIRLNTAAEGGEVVVDLGRVDGNGKNTTAIESLDDESLITYGQLLDFDGYLNVQSGTGQTAIIVAQGDIGQNELTNDTLVYPLGSFSELDNAGTLTFIKRMNGEVLATIRLNTDPRFENQSFLEDSTCPSYLYFGAEENNDNIALTLNEVDKITRISETNISKWDDGTPFDYHKIVDFNGSVHILIETDYDYGTFIWAEGYLGDTMLTGNSVSYQLDTQFSPGVMATFHERINGEALAIIDMEMPERFYDYTLNENDRSFGGKTVLTLDSVYYPEFYGLSRTNISGLDDGTPFGYADVLSFIGFMTVSDSSSSQNSPILIARDNIGAFKNADGTNSTVYYFCTDNTQPDNHFVINETLNPNISLQRGKKYVFDGNCSSEHPLFIKSAQSSSDANVYNEGVINNGSNGSYSIGYVAFWVPMDAPDTLYYNCEFHSEATGVINIVNP